MKTAIIVLSDPASGSDEALGRVYNALAAVPDLRRHGAEVVLLFVGAGTRWIAELRQPAHPAHSLYLAAQDAIAGASAGCAAFFGAADDLDAAGIARLHDNPVPGTPGLPSLARLLADGYGIVTF